MAFAATNNPNDTSDQTVTNLPFYPSIVVTVFKKAVRLQDSVTDQRVIESIRSAMIAVNDQLVTWQAAQVALGYATLAEVPSDDYSDVTKFQHCYLRAVYATTKAELLDYYRDSSTTDKGNERADEFETTTESYLTEAKTAIRKILGKPRSTIELI